MMICKNGKHHTQKGITILETVVSLGIVSLVLVMLVTTAKSVIGVSTQTQKQIIATNLAREAMETVRYKRDRNWTQDILWSQGFTTINPEEFCYSVSGVTTRDADLTKFSCTHGIFNHDESKLYQAEDGSPYRGLYGSVDDIDDPNLWVETPFRRIISFVPKYTDFFSYPSDEAYTLRVEVAWIDGGDEHRVVLEEDIYNWKNQCIDEDGDTFGTWCEPGPDCDDSDPLINPLRNENPGPPSGTDTMNKDENCDGTVESPV